MKGVHIWDKNAEQYDPIEKKDAGGIYGFLWRHFGAKYKDCDTDYTDQGIDQVASVIRGIKTIHTREGISSTAGAPTHLHPFHPATFCTNSTYKTIRCVQMYQRSADLFLGVPFNIASTALLTHLIAHECDLNVGKMHITFGDCHIYENHTNAVMEQLGDCPRRMPQISIVRPKDLWNVDAEEIIIPNYCPDSTIKAEMIA